jgi:hypothetical protein
MKERGEFEVTVYDGALAMKFSTPDGCPGPGMEGPVILAGGVGPEYKAVGDIANRAKRSPEEEVQEGDMLLRIGRKPVKHHDAIEGLMGQAARPVVLTFRRPPPVQRSGLAGAISTAASLVGL